MKRVLLIAAMVACSAQAADLDLTNIRVKNSEFDSFVRYAGPGARSDVKVTGSTLLVTELQVKRDKATGSLSWTVVLGANYTAPWRYYDNASLSGGKLIPAIDVDRTVGSCSYGSCDLGESVWLRLDQDDVRKGLAEGLKLRWNARSGYGSFEVELSQAYFAAMAEAAKR